MTDDLKPMTIRVMPQTLEEMKRLGKILGVYLDGSDPTPLMARMLLEASLKVIHDGKIPPLFVLLKALMKDD